MSPLPKLPKGASPGMWEAAPESVKKKSIRQEKRLAKEHGLRTTIMSGALPSIWQKEDAYDPDFQVQMKRTEGKDARILTVEALETLTRNAYALGRDPVVLITFVNAESPTPKDWALIPAGLWREK